MGNEDLWNKERKKMTNRIIADITNFIFISDEPEKVDAIFLPGGAGSA